MVNLRTPYGHSSMQIDLGLHSRSVTAYRTTITSIQVLALIRPCDSLSVGQVSFGRSVYFLGVLYASAGIGVGDHEQPEPIKIILPFNLTTVAMLTISPPVFRPGNPILWSSCLILANC